MRDPQVRADRLALLSEPHMAPLVHYADKLCAMDRGTVPHFDPLDGGIKARALFLLEKPGPMTDETGRGNRSGSGFISRNNDDPTAEATFHFMNEAGLPRTQTLLWNVIPWWNGTRAITRTELQDGVACVHDLIALLPDLTAVVLVGKKAARAERFLRDTRLNVLTSDHPSPLVRARYPERWQAIPQVWSRVRQSFAG
jgi:uracil-DNA glycosylase